MPDILGWLIGRTVKRAVHDTIEQHLRSDAFRNLVLTEFRAAMPHFDFVKQIQERLQEADPTMSDKRAYGHAELLFNEWCRDEQCKFGDPRFDWSREGARAVADEDIAHWETAP